MNAPSSQHRSQHGFALIMAVVLLAFVALLVLSLASLTRVATQTAGSSANQAQARQNAIMALHIALGQLQKYAGPDQRVTATAESLGRTDGTAHYTGVWDSAVSGKTPMIWLASGNNPGAAEPAALGTDTVELVGKATVGEDAGAHVAVPLETIKADGVPGQTGSVTIGHYGWWVGDEGVKASIGLPDRNNEVIYKPYDTIIQRYRIRQQIAGTPNYFRVSGDMQYGFDPLVVPDLGKIVTYDQLRMVAPAATVKPMEQFLQEHYHDFTRAAYSVLANTQTDGQRGLMIDLSIAPVKLGNAFAAYADYTNYMEEPSSASTAYPKIMDEDSPRRRYLMTPHISGALGEGLPNAVFSVAPVLSDFLLQISVTPVSATKVHLGFRFYVTLWNPYSAALKPDASLHLDISGLPATLTVEASTGSSVQFNLPADIPAVIAAENPDLGRVMRVYLPFDASTSSGQGSLSDKASWLPGRVYSWRTKDKSDGPLDQNLHFYDKSINNALRWYSEEKTLSGANKGITVKAPEVRDVRLQLSTDAGVLATYTMPPYQPVDAVNYTSPKTTTAAVWLGYAARLNNPSVTDTDRSWLSKYDPRQPNAPSAALVGFDPSGDVDSISLNPNLFNDDSPTTVHSNYLLYRVMGGSTSGQEGLSAYNDVPLFELPRMPLLSVGELQHLQLDGQRPFAVGNSWGGAVNSIFDRFFFSGLPPVGANAAKFGVPDITKNPPDPLPNWNLQPIDTRANKDTVFDVTALRDGDHQDDSPYTSRYLLQGGGFNINSVSQAAWRAVLSGVRFGDTMPFYRAAIDYTKGSPTLGSQPDPQLHPVNTVQETFTEDETLGIGFASSIFLRFPQSAQETYDWRPGSSSSNPRQFPTDAFRLGVRGYDRTFSITDNTKRDLTAAQIENLATQITELLKERERTAGPYQTLESFLDTAVGDGGSDSLLEAAIAKAGINPKSLTSNNDSNLDPGFSSLTLTQADIMSALAPYFRTRSDTFVIRTYGDVVSPATGGILAKAWLEAKVQRIPETFDPDDSIIQPAGKLGRRLKVIYIRWLTTKDI